jgi:hypothetical protein
MTLRWVPGWNGLTEPEAVSYVAAVEAADGQELEFGVARAINDFVVGCKNDGIWDAIKASCILAGARTLNGALVPLVKQPADSAPARFGTEGGWNYNRETGLQGNGTDNYINSGRNNNADPQDNQHIALSWTPSAANPIISSDDSGGTDGMSLVGASNSRSRTATNTLYTATGSFVGMSRSSASTFNIRYDGTTNASNIASATPTSSPILAYRFTTAGGSIGYSSARLAFYSIGESLDLEKLDNRVTRLMNLITYTQTAGLPDLATMDIDAAAYIGGGYRVGGTLS